MKIFLVYAHPEPKSFNGALKNQAVESLTELGHDVKVSDLYEMDWTHYLGKKCYTEIENKDFFKPQQESMGKKFIEPIKKEMEKVAWSDLVILQFPIYWFSMPGIMKNWVDCVFARGFAYGGDVGILENGGFKGKKLLISMTTGGPSMFYSKEGQFGEVQRTLFHIAHGMGFFCGMDSLKPAIWFSPARIGQEAREKMLKEWAERLKGIENEEIVPFHHTKDYDENTYQLKKGLKTNLEILGDF
ncbi:nad p h oxidoreductase-related [Anaeramoeba flamelloides]|uniref:Nad p h oxidoreductase-related n=1 Tax=Anaeramoeba flamelloides TaxID=1746091 RepID=A0ABQ8YMT2_9EUKA|nr:nad p h oxidoreductase-related [Anaeramoeba flamelloides]